MHQELFSFTSTIYFHFERYISFDAACVAQLNHVISGWNCDIIIDYCANVMCSNGGICENHGNDFMCICQQDTTGQWILSVAILAF